MGTRRNIDSYGGGINHDPGRDSNVPACNQFRRATAAALANRAIFISAAGSNCRHRESPACEEESINVMDRRISLIKILQNGDR